MFLSKNCWPPPQERQGIDGAMLADPDLSDQDLVELGIGLAIHRRRILRLIQDALQEERGKEEEHEMETEAGESTPKMDPELQEEDQDQESVEAEFPDDFEEEADAAAPDLAC